MISMTLRVTTENGTGEYQVGPKVQVAFEREWKVGLPKAFGDQQRLEHLYWLAWKAVESSGEVVKPFESWLDSVKTVEMAGQDGPL
jgi:ribulose bisphosphate carboxylase small subunit